MDKKKILTRPAGNRNYGLLLNFGCSRSARSYMRIGARYFTVWSQFQAKHVKSTPHLNTHNFVESEAIGEG